MSAEMIVDLFSFPWSWWVHYPISWEKYCWSESCGREWLLFESNQATECFFPLSFLFRRSLPLSASLPSIFPPFLKTHRSSYHVIHGIKWECRAGMSLWSPQTPASLSKAANWSHSSSSLVFRIQILMPLLTRLSLGFALWALFLRVSSFF